MTEAELMIGLHWEELGWMTFLSIVTLFSLPRPLLCALIGLSAARQAHCHAHDDVMHECFDQV